MQIFHFNDEEKDLHRYLAERGHRNVILGADEDPFPTVRREPFDAAFIGLHPHGLRLIRALHRRNPYCLATIIASDQNVRMAVEAMKLGAFDYLFSPLDFNEVERTCIMMVRERRLQQVRRDLEDRLATAHGLSKLVGQSQAVENLRLFIDRAAAVTVPVLITGPMGTGKGLIAQLIHEQSSRSQTPLVRLSCRAVSEPILESELFGWVKGAFAEAEADHPGTLAQATGGTIFLENIDELPLSLQPRLLRALQDGEVWPAGARTARHVDVRFIAASRQPLDALVSQNRFQEDLYYGINVLSVHAPPLRQRVDDIADLVRHFIEWYCTREGREPFKIAPEVWRWMRDHPWPGNVRELENFCRRAVALSDGDTLDMDVLSLCESFAAAPPAAAAVHLDPTGATDMSAIRQNIERQMIEQALIDHDGNVVRCARALGISRTTFYAKVKQFGIDLRAK